MASTLVNFPRTAKAGDVIEIRATIAHPMETGFRPDNDGKTLPRNIITRFSCRYNGELIFSADLFSAVAANPYLAFHTVATTSGTLQFQWEGDHGFSQTENATFTVTP